METLNGTTSPSFLRSWLLLSLAFLLAGFVLCLVSLVRPELLPGTTTVRQWQGLGLTVLLLGMCFEALTILAACTNQVCIRLFGKAWTG